MKHDMYYIKEGKPKRRTVDAIFVLGSHDLRVAERGAQLYIAGHAPLLVIQLSVHTHQ